MKNDFASIEPSAKLGRNVVIGYASRVESNVVVGDNVTIGSHSIVKENTTIGSDTIIQDHVVLGKLGFATPGTGSPGSERKTDAGLTIGRNCTICTGAVCYAATTIGDNAILADGALIRELVTLHEGVRVGKYAIVEWGAQIGKGSRISAFSLIVENMQMGEDVFVGPHVCFTGDLYMGTSRIGIGSCVVQDSVRIGANCTILPKISIGRKAVVAAGSFVTKDVPDHILVAGSPARPVRRLSEKDNIYFA